MCICCVFKQKTAYDVRISDWSSDVCSSDLLFLHRQRVHVGAHEDRRTVAIFEQADDAGAADLLGHGKARVAQMLREDARGADLLHPEFGVLVEVLVKRVERRIVLDRKSTRLNSSHYCATRMPSSA